MLETELFLTSHVECGRPKFTHFDKDGFDLSLFEGLCYESHGFPVDHTTGRLACLKPWNVLVASPRVRIDHAYILTRFGFAGDLADQIRGLAAQYKIPELIRLTQIRPKIGIDINLEYIYNGTVYDLFHYEEDFIRGDIHPIESRIKEIETIVATQNWDTIADVLMKEYDSISQMTGDDANDYRARLAGLDRAYQTYQVL